MTSSPSGADDPLVGSVVAEDPGSDDGDVLVETEAVGPTPGGLVVGGVVDAFGVAFVAAGRSGVAEVSPDEEHAVAARRIVASVARLATDRTDRT
ncbi:MAG: hypothetical protein ABJH68_01970 [Ilumatobacter sp.]|uniref:hypothetical protein n=1 Tax=Ilumatobacter sp. TaxID=1967498 RepID=UPI003297569B